jgi:tetratricopeptide (TPR) repeat protein
MLSQAREIDPADPEVNAEEGLILARSGDWNEAEPLLKKTLVQQPQNENVLSALGLVAWQYHHDRTKAIELFTRALAVHPDQDDFNASLHSNLATIYADQGDYPAAIQQFKLAVSIAPQDAQYHINLANALGAANRLDEARSEAETALQLSPNDPAARAVLQNLGVKQ